MSTVKFTTSTTGSEKPKPVAVLARQRIDAVVGSIIQLDGRESYDPQSLPLTWKWRFVQTPIGSALTDSSFNPIRPKSRAVSFTPDKIGVYIVELVVNNGEQDSDPVTAYASLQISRVPCGENLIQDAHFLWSYISDFWKLVDDRYMIETIWSSVIQIIGSELITLWDTDNNKSIGTIQERFQRRWQPLHPVTELIDEPRHRVIVGKTDSGNNAATGVYGEIPTSGNTSIIYTTLGEPRDVIATDFTNLKGNYGAKGRIIVVNGEAYTINRTENNTDDGLSLVFTDEVVVPDGQAGVSWRIPHLLHMPDVDLEAVGARAGDVLVFEVTRRDIGLSAELRAQVVGADRNRLGFEFTLGDIEGQTVELQTATSGTTSGRTYTHPSAMFQAEGVKPSDTLVLEGGVGAGSYQIVSVISDTQVTVDSELSGGGSHSHQVLRYNTDGNVDIELFKQLVADLRILPPDSTDSEKEAVAKTVLQFMPTGINLNTRPFTKFQLVFKAKKIIHNTIIETDDTISSVPALQEKVKDAPVVLRENLDYVVESGHIEFVSGLFTPEDPAPEELWAESVWYDNDVAIENNFGRLVELKKEDLTASETRAPYLSAVKGLMYAFTNNSDVANLRLALQILLGLPFSEERGLILEINESFSTDTSGNVLGRILMEDLDEDNGRTGVRRFYFYSAALGLEVNRTTNDIFKVGDIVEQFSPLSKGVEVTDYLKDPNWWQSALVGLEILKYFTFQVTIESLAFDANDVTFARRVLDKVKPAYVRVVTAIRATFEEDIEVTEIFGGYGILNLYEDLRGIEASGRVDDYNGHGATLYRIGSHPFETRIPSLLRDVETSLFEGSDQMVNGDFSNWIGGYPVTWGASEGAGGAVSERAPDQGYSGSGSGACNLYAPALGVAGVSQSVSVDIGEVYQLTFEVTNVGDANSALRVFDVVHSAFDETFTSLTVGEKSIRFAAGGSTLSFLIRTQGTTNDVTIDNVELRKLAVRAESATGWDSGSIRGRDSSLDPVIEGDHLFLHEGQPGAAIDAPGIYEIANVIDANTLELLALASGPDPETFQTTALDPDYFQTGTGLTATILRRQTNPVLRGDDITFALGNVATSPTANFLLNNVSVGDHLIIESGVNRGEYYITALPTPPATFISETQLAVLNLDGSVPSLAAGPSPQYFRVIRPIMAGRRFEGAWSRYNGTSAQMELLVPDPDLTTSNPFDVFTPGMVGSQVNVAQSEAGPVNDGDFAIIAYLGPGKVAISSGSTTNDASPESVITLL